VIAYNVRGIEGPRPGVELLASGVLTKRKDGIHVVYDPSAGYTENTLHPYIAQLKSVCWLFRR